MQSQHAHWYILNGKEYYTLKYQETFLSIINCQNKFNNIKEKKIVEILCGIALCQHVCDSSVELWTLWQMGSKRIYIYKKKLNY